MINTFSDNEEVRGRLKEYLLFRIKRGLKENQWQIILDDLRDVCKTDNQIINKINNAIAGGYHVIVAPWEKKPTDARRSGVGGIIDVSAKSIKDMTPAERKKWEDELVRDDKGDLIAF